MSDKPGDHCGVANGAEKQESSPRVESFFKGGDIEASQEVSKYWPRK